MLKASTSRLIYCIGLFALTACAVLPAPVAETEIAIATSAPLSTEERLAHSIRVRIELEAALPDRHPERVNAAATEEALRSLAFDTGAESARKDLIAALADELSAALAERATFSAGGVTDKARAKRIDHVINGLLGAINAEVHRNRV